MMVCMDSTNETEKNKISSYTMNFLCFAALCFALGGWCLYFYQQYHYEQKLDDCQRKLAAQTSKINPNAYYDIFP